MTIDQNTAYSAPEQAPRPDPVMKELMRYIPIEQRRALARVRTINEAIQAAAHAPAGAADLTPPPLSPVKRIVGMLGALSEQQGTGLPRQLSLMLQLMDGPPDISALLKMIGGMPQGADKILDLFSHMG